MAKSRGAGLPRSLAGLVMEACTAAPTSNGAAMRDAWAKTGLVDWRYFEGSGIPLITGIGG